MRTFCVFCFTCFCFQTFAHQFDADNFPELEFQMNELIQRKNLSIAISRINWDEIDYLWFDCIVRRHHQIESNQINSSKIYFQQKNISYRNDNVHILVFVSKMFYSFASQLNDVRFIMGWHFCWFDRSILFLSHINGCDADVRKIHECHIFFFCLLHHQRRCR